MCARIVLYQIKTGFVQSREWVCLSGRGVGQCERWSAIEQSLLTVCSLGVYEFSSSELNLRSIVLLLLQMISLESSRVSRADIKSWAFYIYLAYLH